MEGGPFRPPPPPLALERPKKPIINRVNPFPNFIIFYISSYFHFSIFYYAFLQARMAYVFTFSKYFIESISLDKLAWKDFMLSSK